MPLSSQLVGATTRPITHDVDARWTMAYAAALGDALPCYMDTGRADGVVAHPLFPVCIEWPVVLAGRNLRDDGVLTAAESMRAVHATHDALIHRPIRPGDRLTTQLTIVGVERREPGAYEVTRLDTTDAMGAPVCTTWMGALYRGVDVSGPDRPTSGAPPAPLAFDPQCPPIAEYRVPIAATAAHVYTECARIWNPIHTDAAVAVAAGLPGLILHGTATLALAVSRVLEVENTPAAGVRRIAGRFGAMVRMPSEIVIAVLASTMDHVRFEVRNAAGERAVRDGLVVIQSGPS
jgi:acyl dehydratase